MPRVTMVLFQQLHRQRAQIHFIQSCCALKVRDNHLFLSVGMDARKEKEKKALPKGINCTDKHTNP